MYKFILSNNRSESVGKTYSFETKKEANKSLRGFIKLHDMERHAGYIVNYSTGAEIHKQY